MRTLVLMLLLTLPAGAATLRPFTTVERPVVRLSDLWDGVAKDRDLGPAPAPGARILVEAPQLAAIARQFGVDWEPASPGDRALVERAGQPLSREAVLAAVRGALAAAGAPADADVEVPAFAAPIVPTAGTAAPSISQFLYDAGTGEFTALVSVAAEGMAPAQTRVAGRIVPMQDLPVPTRAIGTGEIVGAADLRFLRGDYLVDKRGPTCRMAVKEKLSCPPTCKRQPLQTRTRPVKPWKRSCGQTVRPAHAAVPWIGSAG